MMVYLDMVLMTWNYDGINLTGRGINHLPYLIAIKYSNEKDRIGSLMLIVNLLAYRTDNKDFLLVSIYGMAWKLTRFVRFRVSFVYDHHLLLPSPYLISEATKKKKKNINEALRVSRLSEIL